MLGFCRNMAGGPPSQPKIHQKWHKRSHKRTVVLWTVTKVMILQRWEVKIINTTISLTPDETKLKSPVERWSAAIKFNCYGFDSRTSVKSFQHLHLKIFTAKDKIDEGWGVVPPNEMTYLFHAYFLFYCSNFGFAGHVKILKWPKIYTKLQVTFPQNF